MSWAQMQSPELAPELLLALVALVLSLLDAVLWPRRESRAASYAALFALLAALAMGLQTWDRPWRTETLWLTGDPAAAFADALVLCGAILAALLALGGNTPPRGGSPILILLSTLGAMVSIGSQDLVTLFVGLELSAISLLVYQATEDEVNHGLGVRAALRYAGPASIASALTVFGIACLWSAGGSPILATLQVGEATGSGLRAAAGGGLLLAGLAIRVGAVPFHLWLADVAVGCKPSAVLLTLSVGVVPALVVLGRLVAGPLSMLIPELEGLLLLFAVLSSTFGALLALPQRRLRRLLGYSILAHVGFALAGIATHAGEDPFSGTAWLQLAALIPAVAGVLAVSALAGPKGDNTAKGLARSRPVEGILLCLFLVALAGLPPTLAFVGRSALWSSLITYSGGGGIATGVLMLDGLILAYALVRFAGRVIFDVPTPSAEAVPAPKPATAAAAILAAAVLLVFGLWPLPIAQAAQMAAYTAVR
jgi:NADH-quinone oxidoreductase subunit N